MTVNELRSAGQRRWRSVSCEGVSCYCLGSEKEQSGARDVVDEVWVCVGDLALVGVVG